MRSFESLEEPKGNTMSEGTAVAIQEEKKTSIVVGDHGVQLTSLGEMFRFGQAVIASGLAPKGYQTPEAVMIAVQFGAEIGLKPMQALQSIAVVNGRPTIWGDGLLALCVSSSSWDEARFREGWEGEGDNRTAFCEMAKRGGQMVRRTFSVLDAKRAKLWDKDTYKQYPDRMLQMRARGFAARDCFPDVLRGIVATEEAQDAITIESRAVPQTLDDLAAKPVALPAPAVVEPVKPRVNGKTPKEPAETAPAGELFDKGSPSAVGA